MITHGYLHHTILKHVIEKGYAPPLPVLASILEVHETEVVKALYALQEYHGVVLHPHKPEVWVIHPFSLAPTNFLVRSSTRQWWGNCAWCSLGIAALLNEDVTITTRYAAHDEQVVMHIVSGEVQEKQILIHFPVPMKNAWDNVIYTCSNMLAFKDEEEVDSWTKMHNIPKGDIQPVARILEFSKKWYGNHLNPEWRKWTMEEAKEIFRQFDLTGTTWDLESSGTRF